MASKKTSKSNVNKSAWIRSQPADKPAAEVVAAAKKQGLTISSGLVYAIRSADKQKGAGKTGAKVAKATRSSSGLGGLEGAIRVIVREELRALLSRV